MGGLPKKFIKQYGITKKAWTEFRKSKKGKGKTNKRQRTSTPSRKGRTVGKRGFLNVSTFFKFIKIAAFVAPAAHAVLSRDNNRDRVSYAIEKYTGYNLNGGYYRFESLAEGWLPYISAVLVTAGVQKLGGIIRRL